MPEIKYEGSECYKNIQHTNDKEQLTLAKRYIEMAISSHRDRDVDNFHFFSEALVHVTKKLSVRSQGQPNL